MHTEVPEHAEMQQNMMTSLKHNNEVTFLARQISIS